MEFFPGLLSRAESDARVERIRSHFAERGFGLWAVEAQGVAPFLGFVGLSVPSVRSPLHALRGDRLASRYEYWGRGYATEAARAGSFDFGFRQLGLEEIVSFTVPANRRSRASWDRLGMTRSPDDDFDHPRASDGPPAPAPCVLPRHEAADLRAAPEVRLPWTKTTKSPACPTKFTNLFAGCWLAPTGECPRSGGRRRRHPPNIVLIYADDLGYGDVGCYGATRVRTPNIDRLAQAGAAVHRRATRPSATCTPSRYALLTGEYAWRQQGTGILPGRRRADHRARPRRRCRRCCKQAGYATGVVGKWHLGPRARGPIDWNGDDQARPARGRVRRRASSCRRPATACRASTSRTTASSASTRTTRSRVSYGEPVGDEPTGKANPELLKMKPSHGHDKTIVNGISRIGYMTGGKSARWVDEDMADTFTARGRRRSSSGTQGRPFFLYFATHDIHVPRVPHPRFAGTSGMRPARRRDRRSSTGASARSSTTLDRLKLADNTLVIFTSDNGPVVDDGYADGAVQRPRRPPPGRPAPRAASTASSRAARACRSSSAGRAGQAGRRPTRWSARSTCSRSFAALTGQAVPTATAPDSLDVLPALLGDSRDRPRPLGPPLRPARPAGGPVEVHPGRTGPGRPCQHGHRDRQRPRRPALRPRPRPRRDDGTSPPSTRTASRRWPPGSGPSARPGGARAVRG